MDITNESLDTMKLKQLRRIIRESIAEVLAEAKTTYKVTGAQGTSVQTLTPDEVKDMQGSSNIKSVKPLEEDELDEMARPATGLNMVNPNFDTSGITKVFKTKDKRTGQTKEISLRDIIEYIKANPGVEKKQIYLNFGFAKPQQADSIAKGLMDAGILVNPKSSNPSAEPGEEQPETIDGPESFLIGSGDPLAGMFDGVPNDDGSEDFNDEEEPTLGDLEIDDELPPAPPTDKEKAADFTTDDVNSRLIQSIINNYTTLKSRIRGSGEMGGLSGSDMMTAIRSSKAAAELKFPQKMQQLIDRIKEQEPAVQKAILDSLIVKFASVKLPSLAKAIAKELNIDASIPTIKTPIEEPEEETEDTIDEAYKAEYEKRKLQFYAGIIK